MQTIIALLLGAIALTAITAEANDGTCSLLQCDEPPSDKRFVRLGNTYYLISDNKVNWFEAAHFCRAIETDLISIESAAELDLIAEYLLAQGKTGKEDYYWTDANELSKRGEFWSLQTGKAMPFTKWYGGKPQNKKKADNCVHLWYRNGEYTMKDGLCTYKTYFICKKRQPKKITLTVW